jgi:selenocysteine-specific elongation factor
MPFHTTQQEHAMPIILGTAGHIDHGKTTLVRALTGIDCDRLDEEKKRGITIELGFAFCDLPNGERLGIVDVPGHERFVKNMVAGAAGIDFVMLVIAADEGIMPQTREHVEICSLLGISQGFVALTKADMVEPEWLDMVKEEVATFLQGTFLDSAPIIPVSATTGMGMESLRAHLAECAQKVRTRPDCQVLRLPVDRVFSLKGHGTVITGTVISGSVSVGDDVVFMPANRPSKVRSLQSHGSSAERIGRGQRCAVNVQGVDVDDIERGFVLAHPETLFPSTRWLVQLTCLASAPRALRHRTEIHFHHGSRECAARVHLLDRDSLKPGESALVELRLAEPLAGVSGDHCVIRAYSPLRTVAGGSIAYPLALPLLKKDPLYASKLALAQSLPALSAEEALLAQGAAPLVLALLTLRGEQGASFALLTIASNQAARPLEKALQDLSAKGKALCFDKEARQWIAGSAFARLTEACLKQAAEFHRKEPLKQGMARPALLAGWAKACPPKLAHMVIERAIKAGELVAEGDSLRLASHKVTLAGSQQDLKAALYKAHAQAELSPPNLKDVLENLQCSNKDAAPVLKLLCDNKELVKVKDGLYYAAPVMDAVLEKVRLWFTQHNDLDLAGLKEMLHGLSRKYLVALMEYMDKEKITVRVGDTRQYRGR